MTDKNSKDFLKDGKSSVALVDQMVSSPALKTVNAARCSYNNEKDTFESKDKKLTKFLGSTNTHLPFVIVTTRSRLSCLFLWHGS